MASLKPTFLWRRILDEKAETFHACRRWTNGTSTDETQATYATIIVKTGR